MINNKISNKTVTLEDNLKFNGVTLLTYKIQYPEFSSSRFQGCLQKVNGFYRSKALEYKRYCENELFNAAVEQYKFGMKNGFPIRVFEVLQTYEVTYALGCVVSLYIDRYEYAGGAHGNTARRSQSWQLQSCQLLTLTQLVRCPPDFRSFILSEVEAQIKEEPDIYFENYKKMAVESFNKNSFYCTPSGIVVYYQQYDIAPYSGGIREFLIPYSDCVINPETMCRY